LHQAIEAKEHVKIQRESVTMATITFQNLFRLYKKLAGMTGTAVTEAEEFSKIYKLEVVSIPTNKVNKRNDLPDGVYRTEMGKFKAVVRDIKKLRETGQPVLVGTASIEKNEILGELLKMEGIPYNLLNAKNHEKEGEWIAQAGKSGAVTVATNMAGRGVDIIIGGNPPDKEEAEKLKNLGGLFVIGTERHESRRIDNQLRGRAGRQGDPGTTQFYVSLEDDLMRIFGSDTMKKRMEFLKMPEDEPIESAVLSKAIASAQRKVEGHHFDIRKHVLEYDDVINKHRMAIYSQRRAILDESGKATEEGERQLKKYLIEAITNEIEQVIFFHTGGEDYTLWDLEEVSKAVNALLPAEFNSNKTIQALESDIKTSKDDIPTKRTKIIEAVMELAHKAYRHIEESVADEVMMGELEKGILLRAYDMLWVDHLEAIDHLRRGIGLQGYAQHDPLVEYKREAYRMFSELNALISKQVAHAIFKIPTAQRSALQHFRPRSGGQPLIFSGAAKTSDQKSNSSSSSVTNDPKYKDVGRNDPCPCGSGKKFKKCHGQ